MAFKLIPGLLLSDWSASTPPRTAFEAAWSKVDQARDIEVQSGTEPQGLIRARSRNPSSPTTNDRVGHVSARAGSCAHSSVILICMLFDT